MDFLYLEPSQPETNEETIVIVGCVIACILIAVFMTAAYL